MVVSRMALRQNIIRGSKEIFEALSHEQNDISKDYTKHALCVVGSLEVLHP